MNGNVLQKNTRNVQGTKGRINKKLSKSKSILEVYCTTSYIIKNLVCRGQEDCIDLSYVCKPSVLEQPVYHGAIHSEGEKLWLSPEESYIHRKFLQYLHSNAYDLVKMNQGSCGEIKHRLTTVDGFKKTDICYYWRKAGETKYRLEQQSYFKVQ